MRFQVFSEDADVGIKPLKIFALNGRDTLSNFAGIQRRSALGRWLALWMLLLNSAEPQQEPV
jgi:hypothetical protein